MIPYAQVLLPFFFFFFIVASRFTLSRIDLEPLSRSRDELLGICPENGAAVLKGLFKPDGLWMALINEYTAFRVEPTCIKFEIRLVLPVALFLFFVFVFFQAFPC